MQIGLDGLTVRAPRWVTVREIETDAGRARGVDPALARRVARRAAATSFRANGRRGAPILYLGRELALAVHPARQPAISADLLNLTVLHPSPDDERQIAAFVAPWLRDEAARAADPARRRVRGAGHSGVPGGEALERPLRMGKLHAQGGDPPQLAARPAAVRTSPTTSSRTKSRTWSSSITRRASGAWSRRSFPGTSPRGARSTTGPRAGGLTVGEACTRIAARRDERRQRERVNPACRAASASPARRRARRRTACRASSPSRGTEVEAARLARPPRSRDWARGGSR